MLARDVANEFDRVSVVVEDLGDSPLAERFGVDKYPALFVDDALVARPEDFYAWGGPATGKYLPWNEVESRRRFQDDVRRMIESRLRGEDLVTPAIHGGSDPSSFALPNLILVDLTGTSFNLSTTRGKPLIIEFWATWCPPCLHTLSWMKEIDPETASVIAIAVESDRNDVNRVVERFSLPGRVVMGDAEITSAFGGLPAIPALFIADRDGMIVRTFYGAPPDLHDKIERELERLGG